MSYNPYQGMESPFFPGYDQSYDRCTCGMPDACGAEHKPAVTVQTLARTTRSGKVEHVTSVNPIGKFYANTAHKAFAVWDGHLALNDLNQPKSKPYQPPALPFVCDRPMSGSSLCSLSSGTCNP
jgi:hypothetical protein